MPSSIERFRRQQKRLKEIRSEESLAVNSSVDYLHGHTKNQMGYSETADFFAAFENSQNTTLKQALAPVSVSMEEVDTLLVNIREKWDAEKLDALLTMCHKQVLSSIVTPFGLGAFISAYDKTGGNVTTVNNAKQGIYAREDSEGFKREDYTGANTEYKKRSSEYRDNKISSDFTVNDEYSGKSVYYKGDDGRSSTDVDHIVPVKTYHESGGFIQDSSERGSFGSDSNNFAVTDKSINRSLQDKDKEKWAASQNAKNPQRTNAEQYDIDLEKLNEARQRGQEAAKDHAPSRSEWAMYYGKRLAVTGFAESAKMGMQQALGLLLMDFFEALIREVKDCYVNGFSTDAEESFLKTLKKRLGNISEKVISDWENVVSAFKDGTISGFLSNLLTVFINTFLTTAKNIVRMIREGVHSLVSAVKLLLFRPDGMSLSEAADAALKLVVSGLFVSVGVIVEEFVSKYMITIPFLTPFSSVISGVLTGALIGIATALSIYALDKVDMFGVHARKCHENTIAELDKRIVEIDSNIDSAYKEAMNPFKLSII